MRDIATHVAAAHGCSAEVQIARGEPPLLNDVPLARSTALLLEQQGHAVSTEFRSFGSDDFAVYGASDPQPHGVRRHGRRARRPPRRRRSCPTTPTSDLVADTLIAGCCAAIGLLDE